MTPPAAPEPPRPRVTVIVPARNASRTLPDVLTAIARADPPADQVIVVDDASSDDTADLARGHGARLLRISDDPHGNIGPGQARNRAAELATGDVLVFVDADVVIQPTTLGRLVAPLHLGPLPPDTPSQDAARPVVATVGSYDHAPPGRALVSQYANLRHHHTHQTAPADLSTFWAGCGAVMADAFRHVGGFSSRYGRPCIEDIELGTRLVADGGTIRSVPAAQCTHLKVWTLRSLWKTDIFDRALPWSRLLIHEPDAIPNQLNTSRDQRLSALLAAGLVSALVAAVVLLMAGFHLAAGAAASVAGLCLIGWVVLNRGLLAVLTRRGGLALLLAGSLLHLAFHLYSLTTFAAVWIRATASPPNPPARPPARSTHRSPASTQP